MFQAVASDSTKDRLVLNQMVPLKEDSGKA